MSSVATLPSKPSLLAHRPLGGDLCVHIGRVDVIEYYVSVGSIQRTFKVSSQMPLMPAGIDFKVRHICGALRIDMFEMSRKLSFRRNYTCDAIENTEVASME